MALSIAEIVQHPKLQASLRAQCSTLLAAYDVNPRAGAVFATQQRWLLAHVGLMMHFTRDQRSSKSGMSMQRFIDLAVEHKVASRNTAASFLQEMLAYNVVRDTQENADRRMRRLEPSPATIEALYGWAMVHLSTLDGLDGGRRLAAFLNDAGALARLQPQVALGLLASPQVREPQRTFSLFTWLNNGGVVMDWLVASIDPADAGAERIPTGVMSISDMAERIKLSRTHLTRKLREAEAMGSLGWEGERGRSRMWVSQGFRLELATAQAVKLAIIDSAFDAVFSTSGGLSTSDSD